MRKMMTAGAVALLTTARLGAASESHDGAPPMVVIDPLRVPIIEDDRASGTLTLKLVMQAHDAEASARLTSRLPALRAASLGAALEFARLYASPLMPVDAGKLSQQLNAALRAEEPGIGRVLLVEVAARRA